MQPPVRVARPYKSQTVIYRAIGGAEYAAIVTDVRGRDVCLTTMPPSAEGMHLTWIPYWEDPMGTPAESICYPGESANGMLQNSHA